MFTEYREYKHVDNELKEIKLLFKSESEINKFKLQYITFGFSIGWIVGLLVGYFL